MAMDRGRPALLTARLRLGTLCVPAMIAAMALPPSTVPARAHPHVFVDAQFALVEGADGGLDAVDVTWQFDAIYTQVVLPDFDVDSDGTLSTDEAAELAGVFFDGLDEYGYFTRLALDGAWQDRVTARDHAARMAGDRLVVTFTIPLPGGHPSRVELIPFDDEVFVAYDIAPADGEATGGGTAYVCATQDYDLESWYLGPVSGRGVVCQRGTGA